MARRSKGIIIFLMLIFSVQLLVSGCIQKQVQSENIKDVSLELEWSKVKKEAGRNMINPELVEIRLQTDKEGRVTHFSWKWIEKTRAIGVSKAYFAEKNQHEYKINSGANTYSKVLKPISMEIALNTIDKYGLNKVFKDTSDANFVLRPAIESKFSVINSKHLLIKGSVEVNETKIEFGKTYIEGLYGSLNGNRQYMFGVE